MKPTAGTPVLEWHETLDSTNSEVRRRIRELDNLSVTAALRQTAGRGRGTHRWCSAAGENLTFSVLLRFSTAKPLPGLLPPLAAADQQLITDITTLSLLAFLREEGVQARIKWPNDIWVDERKICGILVENILRGPWVESSIVGIGLNLNQRRFPDNLPNPTSLSLLTGRKYDLSATLERCCAIYAEYIHKMSDAEGRKSLAEAFKQHVFILEESRQQGLDEAIARFEASF